MIPKYVRRYGPRAVAIYLGLNLVMIGAEAQWHPIAHLLSYDHALISALLRQVTG